MGLFRDWPHRKWGTDVFNKGVPLSLVMKLMVLIALNLALLRAGPFLPQSPPLLFALVMLDLVLFEAVILGRSLRAFHYTFLVVGLVASIALNEFANAPPRKEGSLRILETLIGAYQEIADIPPWNRQPVEDFVIAERCVTSTLGLLLAWAARLWVARLMRRRQPRSGNLGRRIAAFFQGALIGVGVFMAIAFTLDNIGRGQPALHAPRPYAVWLGLAIFSLLGGTAVLLLRSQRDTEGPVNRP